MTRQEFVPVGSSQSSDRKTFYAALAMDATPHSLEVIQNLHYYLSPAQTVCDFLYVLPDGHPDDRKFSAFDEEVEQETARVVNQQFDQYADILLRQQLVVGKRHFSRNVETVEDGVLQQVENQTPDLLVLGMHEAAPKRKGWRISSTGYAIATHAPCSVMVLKQPVPHGAKLKVLFATDGSLHAEKAIDRLIRFLPRETSEIMVLSVVSVNSYVLPVVEPYVDYRPLEHAMQGEAVTLLERTRSRFEEAGYTVTNGYFNLGDPVEQILAEADKNGIDLVVLGSHGQGGRLTHWLLGSVSSKVLEYSNASVAILR